MKTVTGETAMHVSALRHVAASLRAFQAAAARNGQADAVVLLEGQERKVTAAADFIERTKQ